METDDYLNISYKQLASEFDVNLKRGLSTDEVNKRLKIYGYNEITEKEIPTWLKFLKRFWGPIPWLIEIAAILSAVLGKWIDFTIISFLLVINAVIDFVQEYKADSAIRELKKRLMVKAKVLRDGKVVELPVRELVPGDIVLVRLGDLVPADIKLFGGDYILVDQSSLTGESLPVTKKVNDIAYAGTIVKKGVMYGIVINTGINTRFGKSAQLIKKAEIKQKGHLHQMVVKITNYLILLMAFLVITVLLVALFRNENMIEFIRFSLVLVVASIPVALPAVLSVTMAIGALNLARRRAIVKHLSAIQELASVDILCVDKTGTLTKNKLRVYEPIVYNKFKVRDVILYGILASNINEKDPIEIAIYNARKNLNISDSEINRYKQVSFSPFDPKTKKSEAVILYKNKKFIVSKGAPQVIADMCNLTGKLKEKYYSDVHNLAERGYRTLGVAIKKKNNWILVGLIPLYDPPRDDAKKTIEELNNYGISVKMVTGDNKAIAKEIARILGIGENIYTPLEIAESNEEELIVLARILSKAIYKKLKKKVSDKEAELFADEITDSIIKELREIRLPRGIVEKNRKEIEDLVESADGFAEVYPEDKFMIVDALQSKGHIVAMTGDGVNDAPALKKADCGIAVDKATDAARAASDIVLLSSGISVIANAIVEARKIFKRMNTYVIYRMSETIRILFFMSFAIIIFNIYPITPLMLVILALLNDIPILMIAYDNASVSKIVEKWNIPNIVSLTTVLGLSGVISTFLLYYISIEIWHLPIKIVSTLIFLKLAVAGHMTLYLARHTKAFWDKPFPSLKLFGTLEATQLVATLFAVYGIFVVPIGWKLALIVWGYAFVWFLILDRIKIITFKLIEKHKFGGNSILNKI